MMGRENILIIKRDHLVSFSIRLASCAVFLVVLYHVIFTPFHFIALMMHVVIMYFCFMIYTARNYIEFDMEIKQCFRYTWVLGLKLGGKRQFNYIEKLFVNKVNLVRVNKYGTNPGPSEFRNTVFKCFLKFDDGEKILFDTDADKNSLLNRLKNYNAFLKTSIFDTTTHETILVESRDNE